MTSMRTASTAPGTIIAKIDQMLSERDRRYFDPGTIDLLLDVRLELTADVTEPIPELGAA